MKRNVLILSLALASLLFSAGVAPAAPREDINISLNQVIETLNPFSSRTIICWQLFTNTYETLFFVNDKGELEPRLGVSWEAAEDNRTYTVKLREGVKFHNGAELTAEDVAWSLEYALKTGPYTQRRASIPGFESARAVDKYTVEIKSATVNAPFFSNINLWGYIVCKEEALAAEKAGTFGVEWVPCGTGPYVITSYKPDAEIKLEAFPDYYRGEARIKKINCQILMDNNTIRVAFEAGDLDFIVVPTASYAELKESGACNTYLSPTNHTSFFQVNSHNKDALADKRVRQAISYAMNREAMCIAAYDGIAQPAYSLFNPDSVPGGMTVAELEAAGIPSYQYNPEKAKALLAEAGYPNGVDIGVINTINGSYWEKMSTVLQSNLADIGVTAKVELADSAACRAKRFARDFNLSTTGTNFAPDVTFCLLYYRRITPEMFAAGDVTDLTLDTSEFEDLINAANAELDPAKRKALYVELIRLLQDGMYTIPTFHKTIPYAYHKDLVCEEINTNYYYVYNFYWAK